MQKPLYSVKDELANTFFTPVPMDSEEVAKRQFKTQINTITLWKENPSDFSLYCLGTFDDETGELMYRPEKVVGGRSVLDV